MPNHYSNTVGNNPERSVFDLSEELKCNFDMGQLIPIYSKIMVPGDTFKISANAVIRMQPLVSPLLHGVEASIRYFVVPIRLIWKDWEVFISGGVSGDATPPVPKFGGGVDKFDIMDYLGLPIGGFHLGDQPNLFYIRAYWKIWSDWYRDSTLQEEVDPDNQPWEAYMEKLAYVNWGKDLFTSAMPWQQRGTTPTIPLEGILPVYVEGDRTTIEYRDNVGSVLVSNNEGSIPYSVPTYNSGGSTTGEHWLTHEVNAYGTGVISPTVNAGQLIVDLSDSINTISIKDLNLAKSIQMIQTLNARFGARYTEHLTGTWNVQNEDGRLQRAEYIGGTKFPIVVSEVLQHSKDIDYSQFDPASTAGNSPMGSMAGHGVASSYGDCGSYTSNDWCIVMGMMSVVPDLVYSSQGIPNEMRIDSRFEFPDPNLMHLDERGIKNSELFFNPSQAGQNDNVFGFNGIFNEFRSGTSRVAGDFRDKLNYWHLARSFVEFPLLNGDFIKCIPDKRIFAVHDEPGLLVNVATIVEAVRPFPAVADPSF